MTTTSTIVPVILSGGSGSRLWPLSRELHPKQLLPLTGEETLLQQTLLRLDGLVQTGAPLVVCNEEHRFMVAEQLRLIDCEPAAILLEPVGRNTAPAIAVAALQALAAGGDPLLLVLAADHAIRDVDAFQAAIERGRGAAADGALVTFGIQPDRPETGYGYIQAGAEQGTGVFRVERFVEKPDRQTAEGYLATGGYTWNSGMFLFRASRYLQELERFRPEMLAACRTALTAGRPDLDFLRLEATAFSACPADSIDYAVMEHTDAAVVVPLAAGWNDVGSWSALWEIGDRNGDGNVIHGDVLLEGCRNNYLYSSDRLVAGVGIEGLVVVETADAVLVASREQAQQVKRIVERLKAQGRGETLLHRRVNRPWGAYETIDRQERFQVKRISVNPGASLSLQKHFHRAEHWVVVQGTALVHCDGEQRLLTENQSTYIPLGAVHRLENPGNIPLELIEVQSGSYLGEDDIVRLEDHFGRSDNGNTEKGKG